MNEDRTAHGELADLRRRVETLETAPRLPNLTSGGTSGVSTEVGLAVVPTTSYVAVSGGQTVSFQATEQGTAVVLAFICHTLEVSAGTPCVKLTVGIDSTTPTEKYTVYITSTASPYTQTDVIVGYFSGLEPGTHTAKLWVSKLVSGTILTYTLNTQAIVVMPL